MDKRFRSSDWLIVVGALLLFAASVQPWWTLQFDNAPGLSLNGYDFGLTGTVPIVILLAIGIITVIIKTDSLALPAWLIHPYVLTAGVGTTAVLIGIRFFWSGFDDGAGVSRGIGLYLAGVAVVIALVGCGFAIRDLRHPPADAGESADDDDEDDIDLDDDVDDEYGYVDDEEEDDLVRRFNSSLPSGETPVYRPRDTSEAPRRTPPARRPPTRRRPPRETQPQPTTRSRRRPAGPPPP